MRLSAGTGPRTSNPSAPQRLHRGLDGLDLLAAEMPTPHRHGGLSPQTMMRGAGIANRRPRVARDHSDDVDQHGGGRWRRAPPATGDGWWPGPTRRSGVQKHHDRTRSAVQLGEQLGVAGERNPGVVDDALVYRGRSRVRQRFRRGMPPPPTGCTRARTRCWPHRGVRGTDRIRRGNGNHGQLSRGGPPARWGFPSPRYESGLRDPAVRRDGAARPGPRRRRTVHGPTRPRPA